MRELEAPPQDAGQQSTEAAELDALERVISALRPVSREARQRIVESVSTFLQIDPWRKVPHAARETRSDSPSVGPSYPAFSDDTSMSPKEFMLQKQARSDVERVACLAYYLTHYRDTPHFKTLDLSKLNTEAAQPKFSNAANSANNAVKQGYLVPSTKGHRQLSAAGELFVQALPDREAAKRSMTSMRPRRTRRSASAKQATA